MRLEISAKTHAFTLTEMMVAIAIASTVLGVTVTSSMALQRSFNAVDNYFATHMQQIRIVDYLARDVKRGLSVTASVDTQTVLVKIPRYIIQAGDAEAIVNPSKIGTPRDPTRAMVNRDLNINYGATTSSVEYKVVGSSILRSQDGIVTTIASSTDNLIPTSVAGDVGIDTHYLLTAITFKPLSVADRSGTIVYSTAYLRNRRRSL
jgi:prepilin-type N-terminal cleavage/methylation domain-containing protein